jgi:hypothetical protein
VNKAAKSKSDQDEFGKIGADAAPNYGVEPGKLAVCIATFLHASTLILGSWISTSTLEEKGKGLEEKGKGNE